MLAVSVSTVSRASANAMSVDFGMFKSQVLAFLAPEEQAQYDSPSVWDTVVLEAVDALRACGPFRDASIRWRCPNT